jgi:hypothetical protein
MSILLTGAGTAGGSSGYPYVNTETQTYVEAMGVEPDDTRKGVVDTLVGSLKSAGVFTKLNFMHLYAAHDADAALINLINPGTFDGTISNSPTFTVDRGYTTNGTTSYIDCHFNPQTLTAPYALNSASMGVWSLTSASTAGYDMGFYSSQGIMIACNISGTSYSRCNSAGFDSIARGTGAGHLAISRTGSGAYHIHIDGADSQTNAVASDTFAGGLGSVFVGGYANTSSTLLDPSARQYFASWLGGGLTPTEVADLHSALNTYKTAVGA